MVNEVQALKSHVADMSSCMKSLISTVKKVEEREAKNDSPSHHSRGDDKKGVDRSCSVPARGRRKRRVSPGGKEDVNAQQDMNPALYSIEERLDEMSNILKTLSNMKEQDFPSKQTASSNSATMDPASSSGIADMMSKILKEVRELKEIQDEVMDVKEQEFSSKRTSPLPPDRASGSRIIDEISNILREVKEIKEIQYEVMDANEKDFSFKKAASLAPSTLDAATGSRIMEMLILIKDLHQSLTVVQSNSGGIDKISRLSLREIRGLSQQNQSIGAMVLEVLQSLNDGSKQLPQVLWTVPPGGAEPFHPHTAEGMFHGGPDPIHLQTTNGVFQGRSPQQMQQPLADFMESRDVDPYVFMQQSLQQPFFPGGMDVTEQQYAAEIQRSGIAEHHVMQNPEGDHYFGGENQIEQQSATVQNMTRPRSNPRAMEPPLPGMMQDASRQDLQ